MSRRNSTDITAEILSLANGGALKTRIVYGANLNFRMAEGYLDRLVKAGLMEREGRRYRATPRGLSFVEGYEGLRDLMKPQG